MLNKIKWYEEVLTQDPGSSLFFPLAQLYAENLEPEKAMQTLGTGLKKHPRHLEAKLLLIDILSRQGQTEKAGQLTGKIASVLREHPLFWANWAELFEHQGEKDLALAVRILGLAFSGSNQTLKDILQEAAHNHREGDSSAAFFHAPDQDPQPLYDPTRVDPLQPREQGPLDPREIRGETEGGDALSAQEPADSGSRDQTEEVEPGASRVEAYQTKTMAEILTAQGNYSESMEIYAQLLKKAVDEQERFMLRASLDKVKELRDTQTAEASRADPGQGDRSERATLIQELERLANRLEQSE